MKSDFKRQPTAPTMIPCPWCADARYRPQTYDPETGKCHRCNGTKKIPNPKAIQK